MKLEQTPQVLSVRVNGIDAQFFKDTGLPVIAKGLDVDSSLIQDRVVVQPVSAGRGNDYENPDGIRDGNTAARCRAMLAKTGLVVYVPVDRMSSSYFNDIINRSEVAVEQDLYSDTSGSAQELVSQVIPESGIQVRFNID